MTMGNLFWLFIFIMSIQPYLRQKLIDYSRKSLIGQIEAKRNSRVVLLVHRQETMGFLGFPIIRAITIEDSEQVIRAIHLTDPEVPLDLIIHTPGGIALAAVQIARAIQLHKGKVTVFIPHYAMSGGSLIALAADEIVMAPTAVMGAVDPQIGQYPAASILNAVSEKPLAEVDDETLILADQAEKARTQMNETVRRLLVDRMGDEKARELAKLLTQGTWTHDYPITFEDAKSLGLKVSEEMPVEIYQLMSLYPQPTRVRPSVEYLPGERRFVRPERPEHGVPKAA